MHAIVFDFDGTLVDTEPLHEIALAEACRPYGVPIAHGSTIGLADEDAFVGAFEAAGRAIETHLIPTLKRAKTAAYLELVRDRQITIYSGALELVRACAAICPVGVCTAAVRVEVDAVLTRLNIASTLSALVTADDVSAKKPNPEGYTLIAQRLGVAPSQCLAIEDSPRGVEAAHRAGMVVVAVAHTTQRDRLTRAHLVHDRIAELGAAGLLDLVKKHNAPARVAHGGIA